MVTKWFLRSVSTRRCSPSTLIAPEVAVIHEGWLSLRRVNAPDLSAPRRHSELSALHNQVLSRLASFSSPLGSILILNRPGSLPELTTRHTDTVV